MNFHSISSTKFPKEFVGRSVKNAFGVDETVVLPEGHWKHFDWLTAQGINMDIWVKNADLDRHRPEYKTSFSGELESVLRMDEKRRYLSGIHCPLFISPDGYKGKIEKYEIPERLETDNDPIQRLLINMLGLEVSVTLFGKYWRYFDWLSEKGDMEKWVIDADIERRNRDQTLDEEMTRSLREHEKVNHLNGVKLPLFITQSGYFDLDLRTFAKEGIERDIINSKEETVPIPLPKKYWKYFDWLSKQGVDMDQWVKDADVSRYKGQRTYTLRSELLLGLQEDEKRRFLSDDELCPFILRPNGY